MTRVDCEWGFSNPGPGTIVLWLEPWADEFEIPARSTVTLHPFGGPEGCPLGQLEWNADHLVLWASASTVGVSIDGVLQNSGSASIPIPDGLNQEMLGIVFADQPAARLGGASSFTNKLTPWWMNLGRRLGL